MEKDVGERRERDKKERSERKKRGREREGGGGGGREREKLRRDLRRGGHSNLPEPHYLFAVPGVVAVYRVLLPLPNVQLLHATQHQLKLSLVKELEPVEWDHFIETVQKGFRLFLHPSFEPPLCHYSVGEN